ncbi:hypothetical protein GGQ07_001620 [Salinibacter ruber]|nr:hypothetical protein [Salinibacter ruber]
MTWRMLAKSNRSELEDASFIPQRRSTLISGAAPGGGDK